MNIPVRLANLNRLHRINLINIQTRPEESLLHLRNPRIVIPSLPKVNNRYLPNHLITIPVHLRRRILPLRNTNMGMEKQIGIDEHLSLSKKLE